MTDQPSGPTDLAAAEPGPGAADLPTTWTAGSERAGLDERVEFADGPDVVLVRDPRYPEGPHLRFTPNQWTALLTTSAAAGRVIDTRAGDEVVDLRADRVTKPAGAS